VLGCQLKYFKHPNNYQTPSGHVITLNNPFILFSWVTNFLSYWYFSFQRHNHFYSDQNTYEIYPDFLARI